MKKNFYEKDEDYILDILEKAEDELLDELNTNIPEDISFAFAKFLATIEL